MRFDDFETHTVFNNRCGQSLIELLVAIGIGAILIIAAVSVIAPALLTNQQVTPIQTGASIGAELLNNVRVWSEGDWHNVLALATGTANGYYLNAGRSPYAAATGTESVGANPVNAGLVGYWPMNEGTGTVASDASGNGNQGTWNGSLIGGSHYAGGKFGGAGNLDGVGNYVVTGTNGFPLGNGPRSVFAWIYFTAASPNYYVFGYGNSTITGAVAGLRVTPSLVFQGVSDDFASAFTVTSNTWHFIGFTYGGGTSMVIYYDGQSQTGTLAIPLNTVLPGSDPSNIGQKPFGGGFYYGGQIDDVRLYNRALSAAEVNQIYNAPIYTRYFYLSDVYRTGGNIVTSGGTYDPSTKLATVVYQLPSGATSSFAEYLTRHGQTIYDETDWSGGPGANGPATTTNNLFSTSSGVSFSTTTGSIYATIPGY
jgi:hypothetical protein